MSGVSTDSGGGADLARRLEVAYPRLPADTVLSVVADAVDAVAYFGVDVAGRAELTERIARSHLDGLLEYADRHPANRSGAAGD